MKKLNGKKVLWGVGVGTGIVLAAAAVLCKKRKTEKEVSDESAQGLEDQPEEVIHEETVAETEGKRCEEGEDRIG